MTDNLSVKVAVRVRPLVEHEIAKGCKDILDVVTENEQIVVRSTEKDKAFTFNYVLPSAAPQEELYNRCVEPLISNIFKGYNVTILAYGQTGSGKTHSMGTAYNGEGEMGVIPRAISNIFSFVKDNFSYDFTIGVSFLELYQEVIYDLLAGKPREQCVLDIREDTVKGIYIPGLTELPVSSVGEVLQILQRGSQGRATGSTAMNTHSSRSHAVFTVNITMNHKNDPKENKQAKLHLVDLAGSERPKKTGAVGNTFKEGVNINKGLFVLGNVISCLGDEKTQHGYIPYRDSNLTRLLKDSLGGNSITLMIACVSPADYNLEETISTLRYADRARKIKNKPIVNQDARVAEINELKKTIQQLRLQIIGQGGPMVCPAEIEILKQEVVALKLKIRDLTCQLSAALVDNTSLHEKLIIFQNSNEALTKKLHDLKTEYDVTFSNISLGIENNDAAKVKENLVKLQEIQKHFVEINNEQKKTEEEIREHEVSFNQHLINHNQEDPKEIDENHEMHTKRQMDLNIQLTEIQKNIVIKEGLAKQLNNQYIVDYEALAENETKIANLQRERDELLELLKNVGNSGKLSEQRRKRVEDLENQLSELKKKVTEQARLIKLKAGNEQKIDRLNTEIIQMKQAKVKLIRTMREESDKFRQWRLQKERECMRLKEQDRKKANEITKIKAMHNKQQIVFRRRMEQAEALNKRLKSALAMRQQVQDTKNSGKAEKLEPWLKQEFDLFLSIAEAKATLKQLLEDRAAMQQQLDELKSNQETADSPESKNIEDELELRSVQIQDIQQKLLDSDEDNKAKVRFDKLQSMSEAKHALKFLFANAAKVHKEKVQFQNKLGEVQDSLDDALEKLKTAESQNQLLKEQQSEEVRKIHEEYQVFETLLKEAEESKRTEELKKTIESKNQRIKDLEEEAKRLHEKLEFIEKVSLEHTQQAFTPLASQEVKPKKVKMQENIGDLVNGTYVKVEDLFEDSDNSLIDDNIEADPDWRKTPLGRRILEEKRKLTKTSLAADFNAGPSKRSSDGGCTCKTDCSRRSCGCKKLNRGCSGTCRCSVDLCQNRLQVEESDSNEKLPDSTTSEDESFKKPRIVDENVAPSVRPKKMKKLFHLPSQ